jgi:hypothetical protein
MIQKDQAFCLVLRKYVLLGHLLDGRRPMLQVPQGYRSPL